MHALLLVLVFVFCLAGFALGLWLGWRRGRWLAATLSVALALIMVRVFFRFRPEVEFALLPGDGYAQIRPWWMFPAGFVFMGAAIFLTRRAWLRIAVEVVAGFMLLYLIRTVTMALFVDYGALKGVPDQAGICRQSSLYSCGAAAASTLVTLLGHPADERRMAELCLTNAASGTDEFAVCRGLRSQLAGSGMAINLVRGDWNSLARQPLPAMATMHRAVMADHWVVVVRVGQDDLVVADPSGGRLRRIAKQEFVNDWRGVLVTATPGRDQAER